MINHGFSPNYHLQESFRRDDAIHRQDGVRARSRRVVTFEPRLSNLATNLSGLMRRIEDVAHGHQAADPGVRVETKPSQKLGQFTTSQTRSTGTASLNDLRKHCN